MKKITQRVIGLLVVFAVLIMSVTVDVPTAKASLLSEVHYTFESGIPSRTVYCNGHTSEVTIYVDGFYCNVSIDSNPIIEARCDKFGTLWLQRFEDTGFEVYWVNYDLEGYNMTPHYFNNGGFYVDVEDIVYKLLIDNTEIPLPTPEDLKNYLENGTPVPGSKPKPITKPDPYPTVSPDSKPTTDPNHSSQVIPSTPPSNSTQNVTSSTSKVATIKKVTTSKNTIKLINSNNKVVDKVTFNKKKLTLSYNGKKIKKVKGVWFTKKGSLVYLKTNSKAYYLNGKKSKLIKSKVLRVKTSSKFATALKLKNGKSYKLK